MHKHHLKKAFAIILSLILGSANYAAGYANGRFFRARCFQDEPEIPPEGFLRTVTKFYQTSTDTAFNSNGKKVPLLALYGPETSPTGECKNLFLDGHFSFFETQFETYYTFGKGFFVHTFLPYFSAHITDIMPSSSSESCREAFEDLQNTIAKKGITFEASDRKGIGDFILFGGWQGKNYDLSMVDFLTAQLQIGILFPTAKRCNMGETCALIPFGFERTWAIPIVTNGAVGFLDWLTFGIRTETLFFFPRTKSIGIRTNALQTGILRLTQDPHARIKEGTLFDVSIYLKADHFMKGFSLAIEFTHEHKLRTKISPSIRVDPAAVNSDPIFAGWTMNIFHINAEYDWSNEDNPYGPIIAFNYNYILSGKRIFNASTSVGKFELRLRFDF